MKTIFESLTSPVALTRIFKLYPPGAICRYEEREREREIERGRGKEGEGERELDS